MKQKIDTEHREFLIEFLEKNSNAIINAELETYKEIAFSDHRPRVYIFTTYTMGIASIESAGKTDDLYTLLSRVISEFKKSEREQLKQHSEGLYQHYQETGGSHITAILCFLPSSSLDINFDKIDEIPIELRSKAMAQTLRPSDLMINGKFKEQYKYLVKDVIAMHYTSFYTRRGKIYKVIHHNDEVLDLPLHLQFGGEGDDAQLESDSRIELLSNLIEIE